MSFKKKLLKIAKRDENKRYSVNLGVINQKDYSISCEGIIREKL